MDWPAEMLHPVGVEIRSYQQSISQSVLAGNTLVVLPTGLGKTIIAILVAARRLSETAGSKVMVLAPTKPLVLQHYELFRKHLPYGSLTFGVLTGETDPDKRRVVFEKSILVFATPEVVRNDLAKQRYTLQNVSLAVFDEAHRCVKDYAYSEVAEAYKKQATNQLVLGLTASPSARRSRVEEICEKLAITNVETRNELDEEVAGYVKSILLRWERVGIPDEYKQVSQILKDVYGEKIQKLRNMHQLPKEGTVTKRMLLDLGDSLRKRLGRGRGSGYLFAAVLLQSQSVSLQHAIELIETQGVVGLTKYLSRLAESKSRSSRGLAKNPKVIDALRLSEIIGRVEHPKQAVLRSIVSEELAANPNSKLIVFTQFRETVEAIVDNLNHLQGVSAVRFVGQATRDDESVGLTQKQQLQILEEFRSGRFNVLVTTSIGEEGLHVPDVDHVIFYEAVPSEIRSIQRRGRTGRTRLGKVTVLMAENTVDEAYYWSSRRKEQQMRHLLETVKRKGFRRRRHKVTLYDYINDAK
jgi:ERCC4-related helicase